MKNILLLLIWTIPFTCHLLAQTDGDQLFSEAIVHEIRVEADEPNFKELLRNDWKVPVGVEVPYRMCRLRIDGQLMDSVAIRMKGQSSGFFSKIPLKIDLNAFAPGQDYDGVKKFNLNNSLNDSTHMRIAMSYYIYRKMGIRGPRTAFTKVYINNVFQGLYTIVEQVDKNFLRNYFADDEGTLYKYGTIEEVVSGPNTFDHLNEIKYIQSNLSGYAFEQALDTTLDINAYLRFFLIQTFINATDNPIINGNNCYIYHEPRQGLISWIPWDLDYSLYPFVDHPLLPQPTNKLFPKMLQRPKYREHYLQIACEAMRYLFVPETLHQKIDQYNQQIREIFLSDPFFHITPQAYDTKVATLRLIMTERCTAFQYQLDTLNMECTASPPPSGLTINEIVAAADHQGVADPNGEYADWVEIFNNSNDTASLRGCYLSNDADFLKRWAFPDDLKLAPHAYLIVWADRDIEQPGQHAAFKLDKSGGQLFLMLENETMLDSMSYSLQTTNIAWALVPNGTGPFVPQTPTFSGPNSVSAVSQPDQSALKWTLSPNPASDFIQLKMATETAVEQPFEIVILNGDGKALIRHCTANNDFNIDIHQLPSGRYTLMLKSGKETQLRAFMKF
ncbi:MAG: CotH kinase family protein [Saprospiraceae bacterium]|nr:CotH kinase family protein [Saprospiraceae bacterium]